MSTQRRANRISPATEVDREGIRRRWFRGSGGRTGISIPEMRTGSLLASAVAPPRRQETDHLVGAGITAPLMSILRLVRVRQRGPRSCDERPRAETFRVATNSLLSDHCNEVFAGLGSLSGSPPRDGAGSRRLPVPQATHRSSLPHIPVSTRPHASPPHLAACPSRRNPLGGKARWQKRFVFPARRMRRGLQF